MGCRFTVRTHESVISGFKCPVILFDYPANIKAFYMRLNEILSLETVRYGYPFPGIGEIVGGSQGGAF
jgi:asparaginyl-tRNA synthetase